MIPRRHVRTAELDIIAFPGDTSAEAVFDADLDEMAARIQAAARSLEK